MKRVILARQRSYTQEYDKALGKRFVAYCNTSGCPKARIIDVLHSEGVVMISGVPLSKLSKLADQFKKALARGGTPIVFELGEGEDNGHWIVNLKFDHIRN